jgi:hypothetical protein
MIHFGKVPNEDKVVIEVSEGDLMHLKNILQVMPLPERRAFYGIKELVENDENLRKYIDPLMQTKGGDGHGNE